MDKLEYKLKQDNNDNENDNQYNDIISQSAGMRQDELDMEDL